VPSGSKVYTNLPTGLPRAGMKLKPVLSTTEQQKLKTFETGKLHIDIHKNHKNRLWTKMVNIKQNCFKFRTSVTLLFT